MTKLEFVKSVQSKFFSVNENCVSLVYEIKYIILYQEKKDLLLKFCRKK